ncbi:aminoglycoside 6-adenylyltransferase [Chlorogloeopsis sp. ULAP01]|uniref:aminoglycoside 6-adenylyltransferase n=1 Tax=Chlorogloeopsis sp. ULAP01 TaxID=3056483 RepID=UPI0025AA3B82|nr:aminoglycoside 6-adenylyltransferase [Chlorogloeopsis sp. ULAP01]MDM9382841.1 aminoglycoside 6-adenylyltransferase [Chlorogloeopsis sp. ULAP01]
MRNKILQVLIKALQPKDFALAFWQGGSAAHGYTDEWSDIDIEVIVEDNYIEETFKIVEASLQSTSAISLKYRVPEPTWHGHSQCFYQLAGFSPFLAIDFAVIKRSSRNDFLDVERHGNPVIAFDKANLVVPTHLDKKEHFAKMKERFISLKTTFNFRQLFVQKEIFRGHFAEAVARYHNYTLNPLVELLGMLYRPYRYDFMLLKYFSRDFPPEVVARVNNLYSIRDLNELAQKHLLAQEIFTETLPTLEKKFES